MLPKVNHTYQNHHLDSARWECYQPRAGDIVISTSIRSGTTWTQEIVRQLIIQRIARFLDIPLSDEGVATILPTLSLEAMRRNGERTLPGPRGSGRRAHRLSSLRARMAAGAMC